MGEYDEATEICKKYMNGEISKDEFNKRYKEMNKVEKHWFLKFIDKYFLV